MDPIFESYQSAINEAAVKFTTGKNLSSMEQEIVDGIMKAVNGKKATRQIVKSAIGYVRTYANNIKAAEEVNRVVFYNKDKEILSIR